MVGTVIDVNMVLLGVPALSVTSSAPAVNAPLALPQAIDEAAVLAGQDKCQFQWWALGLVNARPVEQKKGADHGIDGKILIHDDLDAPKPEQIILRFLKS